MKTDNAKENSIFCVLWMVIFLSISCFSGCSQIKCVKTGLIFNTPNDFAALSYKIADILIAQAAGKITPASPDTPILVTTFVDNNNLQSTSKFGRLIQEQIESRFVHHQYAVREIKLGDTLFIEPGSGETILTRELARLTQDMNAQAILVGTYSRTNRQLYIATRLINPENNNIIAANDETICLDDEVLNLLNLRRLEYGDEIEDPGQPLLNRILP